MIKYEEKKYYYFFDLLPVSVFNYIEGQNRIRPPKLAKKGKQEKTDGDLFTSAGLNYRGN